MRLVGYFIQNYFLLVKILSQPTYKTLKFLFYACLNSSLSLYFSERAEIFIASCLTVLLSLTLFFLRSRWTKFILPPPHSPQGYLCAQSTPPFHPRDSDSHPLLPMQEQPRLSTTKRIRTMLKQYKFRVISVYMLPAINLRRPKCVRYT